MKRLAIAFISEHASPLAAPGSVDAGGQNVYVRELALELSKLGFKIDIFTRRDGDALPDVVEWMPNIRVIHVSAGPATYIPKESLIPYMDDFAKFMIRYIEKHRQSYKMLHANFFMSGMVALKLKEILRIPFVITFHALGIVRALHQKEADKFPRERVSYEKKIVRNADKIIAECPQDAMDLINLYNADPEKMDIIPCGFNPDEFSPVNKKLARKKLGLSLSEKIILSVGRIVPRKGVDNIISSLKYLKKRFPDIRLLIVGGDTDKENGPSTHEMKRLKEVAVNLQVDQHILFYGPKLPTELKYYYSAADLFISTPWYEPFGITPLESMACGTPVIGSDVGGIKYTILDGETGFLVPPREPLKLANRVTKLLSDNVLLRKMQKESIKRVNSLFTWQRVANEMREAYYDLMTTQIAATFLGSRQNIRNPEPVSLRLLADSKNKSFRINGLRNN
mgnify:CR=1 FL=1